VVTQALTHALSICGYLFLDQGDDIIIPDLFWGNYRLLFSNAFGAVFKPFNTFRKDGFDLEALERRLAQGAPGKRVMVLNFPNNPTGYTVTGEEAAALREILVASARAGNKLLVLIDDAYFGLVYKDGVFKESIFSMLSDAHENILAVKIDGSTKEDYVWGFRVGFITYGIKDGTQALYAALESKTGGAIRGNISNSPNLSQTLMLKAFTHPDYPVQKAEKYNTLKARYEKLTEVFANHPEYAGVFEPLPFNSGYFMCVRLASADPEKVRRILLDEFDTGLIAASGFVRVAFSSTPIDQIDTLFANLYKAALKAQ